MKGRRKLLRLVLYMGWLTELKGRSGIVHIEMAEAIVSVFNIAREGAFGGWDKEGGL
jgi:hypothetical protein